MKKVFSVLIAVLMIFSLVACSNTSNSGKTEPSKPVVEPTESEKPDKPDEPTSSEVVELDFEHPSIVIDLGHVDELKDFASKMQNFEIEEGTVVKIVGKWSKSGMTPSVMQEDEAAGASWGVQMFFDYEQEDLVDGTPIEVVGHAVKGDYFMEFHVAENCLKLVEDSQSSESVDDASQVVDSTDEAGSEIETSGEDVPVEDSTVEDNAAESNEAVESETSTNN